jgi:hypothetical protein
MNEFSINITFLKNQVTNVFHGLNLLRRKNSNVTVIYFFGLRSVQSLKLTSYLLNNANNKLSIKLRDLGLR